MMKRTTKLFTKLALVLAFSLTFTSFSGISFNARTAEAAVTESGIIYEGNGTVTKTLLNGKKAKVTLNGSVPDIQVDGAKYNYYNTICTANAIISDDDLLHMFWHTGEYFVYDLYENGMFLQAGSNGVKGTHISYKIVTDPDDAQRVRGSSTANSIKSAIIDKEYFYMYGSPGKKRLMTRAEFDILVGREPEQTATPLPTATATPKPTQKPTQAPTTTPAPTPSRTPDIEIDTEIKTEIDFEFWWKQYTEGTITWDQLTQILWKHQWTVNSQTTEKETTYYFYDESGKLIRTERVLVSNGTQQGKGEGSATSKNEGEAKVEIKNEGEGGGHISAQTKIKTGIKVNKPFSFVGSTKSKTTFHVVRKGKWVKLTMTVNGKTGTVCRVYFNKKKKIAKFDGIKYKGINYVGYTGTSRQICLKTTKGKIKIAPRAKGKVGKTYTAKTLKGKWKEVIEDSRGLSIRASDCKRKVKGIKNAQPKKLKR